jgi:hypothetical protein
MPDRIFGQLAIRLLPQHRVADVSSGLRIEEPN